jgi:hypothetical protein
MRTPQDFYSHNGPMTARGAYDGEFRGLPRDLGSLCEVVQGVLIHRDVAPWLYNLKLTEEQREDGHIRPLEQMLTRIHELDPRSLNVARDVGHRLPSVCRHFSLMLCSMLRDQGVPARLRCGFGASFTPGKFEDHWVCEYWNVAEKRWILVDAQLDAIQRKALNINFNPLDVPRDCFIIAGDAWQMCRNRGADPAAFGLTHAGLAGLWFVAGNVVRDLASLNQMEMLPWDVWGLMELNDAGITDEKKVLLDRVAALTLKGDDAFGDVREVYESDSRLRVPPVVFNALHNASEKVAR